ncbi:MAG: hypothetical protein WCK17_13560 [Verrucomicrobiota bacterium]
MVADNLSTLPGHYKELIGTFRSLAKVFQCWKYSIHEIVVLLESAEAVDFLRCADCRVSGSYAISERKPPLDAHESVFHLAFLAICIAMDFLRIARLITDTLPVGLSITRR